MYPTKSMFDYMSEMNRLFPRNTDNHDIIQFPPTPNSSMQSSNQSTMMQLSSSTDTSPDSFPDLTSHRYSETGHQQHDGLRDFDGHGRMNFESQIRPHYDNQMMVDQFESHMRQEKYMHEPFVSQQMHETPFVVRQQRPIVGRKLMASDHLLKMDSSVIWPEDIPQTPPKMFTEQKYNHAYELFPPTNKGFEFKTPKKTSPSSFTTLPNLTNVSPMTSPMRNLSPRMNASPNMMNMASPRMADLSPNTKTSPGLYAPPYSPRFSTPTFREPIVGSSASFRPNMGPSKMCTFCRKNGETPLVYMDHTVKEKVGNKNIVTCPILRSHVCSACGASGDNAHTITYCPILRSSNNGQPLQSTTITLKNTRVKSNGRRRY